MTLGKTNNTWHSPLKEDDPFPMFWELKAPVFVLANLHNYTNKVIIFYCEDSRPIEKENFK